MTEILVVPLSSELVTIVDKDVTSPDSNGLTALEILGSVILNWAHICAGVVSKDWFFSELLAFQKHSEGMNTAVGFVDLLNFNGLIREEVVKSVVFVTTIITVIAP